MAKTKTYTIEYPNAPSFVSSAPKVDPAGEGTVRHKCFMHYLWEIIEQYDLDGSDPQYDIELLFNAFTADMHKLHDDGRKAAAAKCPSKAGH